MGQWVALAGAAVAVGVAVALVVSLSNGGGGLDVSQTAPMPTAQAAGSPTPATQAAARPAAASAPKPDGRSCEPIFGGGVPHRVISSADRGTAAGCGRAHAVLLAALNGGGSFGDWHCVRDPGERTLEACTSGGRRIVARD